MREVNRKMRTRKWRVRKEIRGEEMRRRRTKEKGRRIVTWR